MGGRSERLRPWQALSPCTCCCSHGSSSSSLSCSLGPPPQVFPALDAARLLMLSPSAAPLLTAEVLGSMASPTQGVCAPHSGPSVCAPPTRPLMCAFVCASVASPTQGARAPYLASVVCLHVRERARPLPQQGRLCVAALLHAHRRQRAQVCVCWGKGAVRALVCVDQAWTQHVACSMCPGAPCLPYLPLPPLTPFHPTPPHPHPRVATINPWLDDRRPSRRHFSGRAAGRLRALLPCGGAAAGVPRCRQRLQAGRAARLGGGRAGGPAGRPGHGRLPRQQGALCTAPLLLHGACRAGRWPPPAARRMPCWVPPSHANKVRGAPAPGTSLPLGRATGASLGGSVLRS